MLLEGGFSLPQNRLHLRDHSHHPVGLRSGRHPSDVRQLVQIHQPATTEVDAVELDLPRCVRGSGRQHQGLQQR